jgi:hypothetical protein
MNITICYLIEEQNLFKDFLVNKGAKPENIITTKYGKERPIAANTTPDGRDNPAVRRLNRRAEFKVLNQGYESLLVVKPLTPDQSLAMADNLSGTNVVVDPSKKYTIQIFALKNPKPIEYFADLVGVKMHVSEDGWYRY